MKYDILKSAGIIVNKEQLLLTRTKGKDYFIAPGGKLYENENSEECLKRELKEELDININGVTFFNTYEAIAKGTEGKILLMHCYIVDSYDGTITPSGEIEEIAWVNSTNYSDYNMGSIFRDHVIPELIEQEKIT